MHRSGGAGAVLDDPVLSSGVEQALDGLFCLVQALSGDYACGIVFGVGVAVQLQHLLHVPLDKGDAPSGGGVVRIGHPSCPEGGSDHGIAADDVLPNKGPEILFHYYLNIPPAGTLAGY